MTGLKQTNTRINKLPSCFSLVCSRYVFFVMFILLCSYVKRMTEYLNHTEMIVLQYNKQNLL